MDAEPSSQSRYTFHSAVPAPAWEGAGVTLEVALPPVGAPSLLPKRIVLRSRVSERAGFVPLSPEAHPELLGLCGGLW